MEPTDTTVTEEAAGHLVAFLEATEPSYVAKMTTPKGSVGYLRPCEYGGFLLKSDDIIIKQDGSDHYTAGETKLLLSNAKHVAVLPAALTPPSVWGETTHEDNPHIDNE